MTGARSITRGDLATSIVIVLLTIVASRNLPGLLEIACLRRLPLDAGGRYALTSVSRYVITVVGLVAGCGASASAGRTCNGWPRP